MYYAIGASLSSLHRESTDSLIYIYGVCRTYRKFSKCFYVNLNLRNFTAMVYSSVPLTEFYSKDLGENENSPRLTARGGRKRRLARDRAPRRDRLAS